MARTIHHLFTPTFEAATDEAFAGYARGSTTASYYSLTAKGRGGKPSLRTGTTANGFGVVLAGLGLGLPGKPLRFSFDVLIDVAQHSSTLSFCQMIANGGSGPTESSGTYTYSISLTSGNTIAAPDNGGTTVVNTGKVLNRNTVYNIEVESVNMQTAADAYTKIWVDGELVLHLTGSSNTLSARNGYMAMRWNSLLNNTAALGTHVSNILVYDDPDTLGTPLGALDFAYVPVQDADLSETRTNDASSFETFSDSVFRDFPLADDTRTGALIGAVASARLRASTENPTLFDMTVDGALRVNRKAIGAAWENVSSAPFVPTTKAGTISLRNSPV